MEKGPLEGTGLSLKGAVSNVANRSKTVNVWKSTSTVGVDFKVPIKAGAMVIIYRGELVRNPTCGPEKLVIT